MNFKPLASCCKYAVPEGYPERPLKRFKVDTCALKRPELAYLGAVDADGKGGLLATGSRTIGVVALADSLEDAEASAESEVAHNSCPIYS